MEEEIVASGERFVMVRPSFLTTGEARPDKKIRVGVEDPKQGVVVKNVGYTISKEDVGRWMYDNVLARVDESYLGRAVSITN